MKLIECIPIGKQNKETRDVLMNKAKITDNQQFVRELADLRKKYIIIFENGYFLPANRQEYEEFIEKINKQKKDLETLLGLAYKEMEGLDD